MRHVTSLVLRFSILGIAVVVAACASNGSAPLPAPPAALSAGTGGAGPLDEQILLVGTRWQAPWNLAVDRAGNVFVTDLPTRKLFKIEPPFTGPTHGTIHKVGTYYWYPWGIAVDNDDNAYISEGAPYAGWFIYRECRNGRQDLVATGAYFTGLAVDAQQNVYAAGDTSVIWRLLRKPGGWRIPVRYGPKFEQATSVAVDAAGNVYVTDALANQVKMIERSGKVVSVGSGYNLPTSVAVSRFCATSCPVYVADTMNNEVKEIAPPFTGATHGTISVIGHGFWQPWGVAVKGDDVYVADTNHHSVKEVIP
ncbi:MAG: NHL repeat-containing protein [Candidatus Eremiobacteraeota bacterium]|nr:NHL repeat-containing protein [Candidatus Eremiobacteraeota bacterium]MBV8498707.1 NHL repeat-containing protein [Candidatus Eremiobacteraeota bacterium]